MEIILTPEQRNAMQYLAEDVDAHLDNYVTDYVNHIVEQQKEASRLAKMNRLKAECLDTDIEEMIAVLDARIVEEKGKEPKI